MLRNWSAGCLSASGISKHKWKIESFKCQNCCFRQRKEKGNGKEEWTLGKRGAHVTYDHLTLSFEDKKQRYSQEGCREVGVLFFLGSACDAKSLQ
jgi:hypothetical protein